MTKPMTIEEAIKLKAELTTILKTRAAAEEAYVILAAMYDELSNYFGLLPGLTQITMLNVRTIMGTPPCGDPDCECKTEYREEPVTKPTLRLVD